MLIIWLLAAFGGYILYDRAKTGAQSLLTMPSTTHPTALPILQDDETPRLLPRRDTKACSETLITTNELVSMHNLRKTSPEYPLNNNLDNDSLSSWGNWANQPASTQFLDGINM